MSPDDLDPHTPRQIANEMILTGRRLSADEALHFGLVNTIVPAGTALQMMAEAQAHPDPVDAVTAPTSALDELIASADTGEGLLAFAEKRPPRWTKPLNHLARFSRCCAARRRHR